jgi:hypothetical protein
MNHRERMRMRQSTGAPSTGNGSLHAERAPQDIALYIDQLMMEGLQPSDRYQFGNAFQTELTRLLAEHGMPTNLSGSAELERLAAGTISITTAPRPATLGRQVAEAVYRGIGQIEAGGSNSSGPTNGSNRGGATR